MKKDTFEGKWNDVKAEVKKKWAKLTNDDISEIHGKEEKLVSKIRERYQIGKAEADTQIAAFMKTCGCSSNEKQKPAHTA